MRKYYIFYAYKDLRKTNIEQMFGKLPLDNIFGGVRLKILPLRTPLDFSEVIELFRDSLTTSKMMPVLIHCKSYMTSSTIVENDSIPPMLDTTVKIIWDGQKGVNMKKLLTLVPSNLLAAATKIT